MCDVYLQRRSGSFGPGHTADLDGDVVVRRGALAAGMMDRETVATCTALFPVGRVVDSLERMRASNPRHSRGCAGHER